MISESLSLLNTWLGHVVVSARRQRFGSDCSQADVASVNARATDKSFHHYVLKEEGEDSYEVNAMEDSPFGPVAEPAVQY